LPLSVIEKGPLAIYFSSARVRGEKKRGRLQHRLLKRKKGRNDINLLKTHRLEKKKKRGRKVCPFVRGAVNSTPIADPREGEGVLSPPTSGGEEGNYLRKDTKPNALLLPSNAKKKGERKAAGSIQKL